MTALRKSLCSVHTCQTASDYSDFLYFLRWNRLKRRFSERRRVHRAARSELAYIRTVRPGHAVAAIQTATYLPYSVRTHTFFHKIGICHDGTTYSDKVRSPRGNNLIPHFQRTNLSVHHNGKRGCCPHPQTKFQSVRRIMAEHGSRIPAFFLRSRGDEKRRQNSGV